LQRPVPEDIAKAKVIYKVPSIKSNNNQQSIIPLVVDE
jgi:hypothetical protein